MVQSLFSTDNVEKPFHLIRPRSVITIHKTYTMSTSPPKKKRRCGLCGQEGHNRTRCPTRNDVSTSTAIPNEAVGETPQVEPYAENAQQPTVVDVNRLTYFVFDLETTGLSRSSHDVIEIACVALDNHGRRFQEEFNELVRPVRKIPPFILELTG